MKIGLIGDIHGNSLALGAVLKHATELNVTVLCVTGDFVGYYYRPDEVLDMLSKWRIFSVQGNHERMLEAVLSMPDALLGFDAKYGKGLRRATELLSIKDQKALCSLPETLSFSLDGKKILLAHGSPWNGDHYLYPDTPKPLWDKLLAYDADLIVLGHTHYQDKRLVWDTLVVNPGSVGQPRDGKLGAAWAIYDTESSQCDHLVEPYDINAVAAEAKLFDPNIDYLHKILRRSWPQS